MMSVNDVPVFIHHDGHLHTFLGYAFLETLILLFREARHHLIPVRVLLRHEPPFIADALILPTGSEFPNLGEGRDPAFPRPDRPETPARRCPCNHAQILVYAATSTRTAGVRVREGLGHRGGPMRLGFILHACTTCATVSNPSVEYMGPTRGRETLARRGANG